MKRYAVTTLFFVCTLTLFAQTKQTKKFFVNSFEIIKGNDEDNKIEHLCEGFDILITTDSINIGDDFNLAITKSVYNVEKNLTMYWVEDQAKSNTICYVFLATDQKGEHYIQIHSCDSLGELIYEGGMIFKHLDNVSRYELWRFMRNIK